MAVDPVTNITWKARKFETTEDQNIILDDFDIIEIRRGHRRMTIRIEDDHLCIAADDRLTINPVGSNWINVLI